MQNRKRLCFSSFDFIRRLPVSNPVVSFLFSNVGGPACMVVSNVAVLPWCAHRISSWKSRKLPGKSVVQNTEILVFIGLFFNTFVSPSVATIIFSTDCFQGFFWLWTRCAPTATPSLSTTVTIKPPDLEPFITTILSAGDVCDTTFRAGYCVRGFLSWIGPFMIRKYLIYSFVGPLIILIRGSVKDGFVCQSRFKKIREFLRYEFTPCRNISLVLSQFEVAVVVGAFVPLLLPAALLSFLTNWWACKTVVVDQPPEHFGERWHSSEVKALEQELQQIEESHQMGRMLKFIFFSPILLSSFGVVYWIANNIRDPRIPVVHGVEVMFVVLAICLLFPLYYFGEKNHWACCVYSPKTNRGTRSKGPSLRSPLISRELASTLSSMSAGSIQRRS